jgi:hypothetical protein
MAANYRRYCRTVAVIFILITIYTVSTKAVQGRLAGDWLHSALHLCSGLVGLYAGWFAPSPVPAKAFTWGIGLLYFALACYGPFTSGLLLGTPLAIPLAVADNVFHLALSVPALAIVLLGRMGGGARRRPPHPPPATAG